MFADCFKSCGVILKIHNFVEILLIIAVVPLSQNWDILGDPLDFELLLLGCNFGISQIFLSIVERFSKLLVVFEKKNLRANISTKPFIKIKLDSNLKANDD